MNAISIIKSNTNEQKQNTKLLNSFVNAFYGSNVDAIKGMLHDDGKFLGKYSKNRMASKFYNLFFANGILKCDFFNCRLNKGIALDKIPGAEVYEIRLCDIECVPMKFGTPANKDLNEKVYRFCFQFKDNLIYDIQIPTRFTDKIEQQQQFN